MAAPAKFLFDTDFSAPKAKERAMTGTEIAQQIADAEARSYRAGYDAGRHEATVEYGRRLSLALEEVGRSMETIARQFAGAEARMEVEAVDVAVAVARKLCSELMAAEPMTEAMALVGDCFRHLTSTPHIVVRINDQLYEGAHHHIERLARHCGFEGRLVVLAEPDISSGDCRIEWADGGVRLDRAATEAKIDELVGRYMASRNQTAAQAGTTDAKDGN
ncbi:FliH/SctL family protein [Bradyrhizobium prioriisuperbiae]|uniref:FliH/SctL family protein n=1 Tax=Bradyrhizobium prioriisuperbiae TaxID=2854389 RepID=UPI0028E9C1C4|nr:FliH/SctL family protein [Bradyrhizobium prioritasuperba]